MTNSPLPSKCTTCGNEMMCNAFMTMPPQYGEPYCPLCSTREQAQAKTQVKMTNNINNKAEEKVIGSMEKEICGSCQQEKIIKFVCHFCKEDRMCSECGYEHRDWCEARDDWEFNLK